MKFTSIKIIGFVLIVAFGVSSCQTLNCGCPMAEVENVRSSDKEGDRVNGEREKSEEVKKSSEAKEFEIAD